MSNKNPRGSFTTLPTSTHYPSGYTFQQRGARVYITEPDTGREVDTISDNALQSATPNSPVVLTPAALRKLATTWLADNYYTQD